MNNIPVINKNKVWKELVSAWGHDGARAGLLGRMEKELGVQMWQLGLQCVPWLQLAEGVNITRGVKVKLKHLRECLASQEFRVGHASSNKPQERAKG